MIASLAGTLAARNGDSLIVQTESGVGYEVAVSQGVLEQLPPVGGRLALHTELVVREDSWTLYGFASAAERTIFQRLLGASGFGPKLALALLSTLGPERTVRSIQTRDLVTLSSVAGVGKKKAERLALELADRFDDLPVPTAAPRSSGADDAVRALMALGYPPAAADDAVRAALAGGAPADPGTLIRRALQQLAAARGGRS